MCSKLTVTESMPCNNEYGKIKKVVMIKKSDLVFIDGFEVRMKRKYGKFKREPIILNLQNDKV